uniref:DUF1618 domain-containing protein n=1 Tax=Setaria viridis TaxID=4556 RepID=A0A4U6TF09_SETVI|nr:hypothetical protein SEVIR_8G038800v2 [Setaria viridis]
MSHRRRVLNLVLKNKFTGVHSLHRLDLLSRQNSLFYPTAKAAEDAAAAKDSEILFAAEKDDPAVLDGRTTGQESLEKLMEMLVPSPRLSFEPTPHPEYGSLWSRLDCAALSEGRTVFVDCNSRGAFLYRRVVTMAGFPERKRWPWRRAYFPVAAGAGGDNGEPDEGVYVIDRDPEGDDATNWLKFQAMVHRTPRGRGSDYDKRWHLDELPRPPFAEDAGYKGTMEIVSYAQAGDASDVICVSTEGRGTHCFDTASRAWSKAGGWALPFAGKIEHDRELGLWLGFVKQCREEDNNSLYATGNLFADVDRRSLLRYGRDDCRNLEPPWGWHKVVVPEPRIVSLGSGKFCVTQFFETRRSACSKCLHEETDKRFALFTGVEVIHRGSDGSDEKAGNGSDEQADNGSADVVGPTELRVVIHKSKFSMLTKGDTIEFVL